MRDDEFISPPGQLDDDDRSGLSRRDFLKLMGASVVMASAAGCSRRPVEKIVPYLNKPEEVTPGVANWYATTCGGCPAACGLLAKTREGRPVKLEGNPDHPMSGGGLCARGQASLLNLYDPDRLQKPVQNDRKKGKYAEIPWVPLDAELGKVFQKIRENGGKLRLLTGTSPSPASQQLVAEFLSTFPDAKQVVFDPLSLEGLVAAQGECYGESGLPRYRFDRADWILSFGADFLDTWLSPVEFTRQFAEKRVPEKGRMSRFISIGPLMTVTASNADLHLPVRPGDETKIALSLAHEIVLVRKLSSYAANADAIQALSPYSIQTVAQLTGVAPELLIRIARELWEHRGRGLVLGGGYPLQGQEGTDLQVAVNFLNSLLENEGRTVESPARGSLQQMGSYAALKTLVNEMALGEVDCLIVHRCNPVYALPAGFEFERALKRVPVVVTLADRLDETALKSDWALPVPHFLESWGDAEPQRGILSLFQPAIAPLYDVRGIEDSLLKWMGRETTWHRVLQDYWERNVYPRFGNGTSFVYFWESSLRRGIVESRPENGGSAPRPFNTKALVRLRLQRSLVDGPEMALMAYPVVGHYDGRSANNSWLMELPDPVSKITWRNWVSLGPQKAKKLGLKKGDVVRLKTASHEAELPVWIQPGQHEQVISLPLGFGRTAAGRVADGVGENAFRFVTWQGSQGVSFVDAVEILPTGKWIRLATTQHHFSLYGRPIVKETDYAEYQKNPKAGNEEVLHLPSMWSGHKYPGHRWGMAIDLNTCTGCSACMIACQAENNIPTVGERQVAKGREMHWIRIDTYYNDETAANPEAAHQPMLCQHCENAPCETVCPTLATLHNEEGLNIQVYNRCVGTRYCSNNCPYKVRRFNWFEYLWKWKTPLAMALNPDVTVREKGVMEKCTFCVQRIQEGKDKAKDFGRKVRDGEIRVACEQSCPARAIVFGDMNDPESRVSKMMTGPRGYGVLAELNTKPAITYLTKVRNKG